VTSASTHPAIPDFIYGTAWKEDRTAALTGLALATGFRAIDTANQRRHYLESGVGEALAKAYREGLVTRADLFLQTKFTSLGGQDHRLPYDPAAPLALQVAQSLASSLEHLGTDYVDSYVLHGPSSSAGWSAADVEAWQAMLEARERGHTRRVGVSNISIRQLEQMVTRHSEPPAFVQNRCLARTGWDREVRRFCRQHNIIYQGFWLLTANPEVLSHPLVSALASAASVTPAQIVFAFVRALGVLPLTGTTNPVHMREDLDSRELVLPPDAVAAIEALAG